MTWGDGGPETRKHLLKRYSEDRNELLEKLAVLYPTLESLRPSEKVELVITDICQFHVVDEPLCKMQLALCDFRSKTVIVNSKMGEDVHHNTNLELLRCSTLAHELGHIRLHADEIAEGCTLQYMGSSGQFSDSRGYQKEREADFYAGIFLVPVEDLLEDRCVQKILGSLKDKRAMNTGALWRILYRLAHRFQVSPTLMKRCLMDLGWLEQGDLRKNGLREIRLRLAAQF